MEIIIAICALILGLLLGVWMGRVSAPRREAEISELNRALNEKEDYFQKLNEERQKSFENAISAKEESYQREIESMKKTNADLIEAMEKRHLEAIKALKEQFTETTNAMSRQLSLTTQKMLKERQEEFSESSGEKLSQILEPLKVSLKQMQEKVSENTSRHTELGGKLSESIKNLLDHTESAQASADRLASILKGSNRHQGVWGERILKEILESLNLQEGIHFDVQKSMTDDKGMTVKNEEGRIARPDIILHLDKNKDVIIDSKVSMSAFLQYQEAETEEERKEALRRHIASLEKHVAELVKKDYSSYVRKPRIRLGYVIMFVPNTSALLLATQAKTTLWREAMEQNVYIADEQTLYAALKIVSLTWQQIQQTESHAKVYQLAEEMLQRVANFMKAYNDIGESLAKASKSFEDGRKKLEDGGQSIPKTCRKLIDLGAKTPKLPKGVDPELFGIGETEELSE